MESNIDSLPEYIRNKLKVIDDHWIWIGAITDKNRKDPKGRIRFQGRIEYPHRVVLFLLKGFNLDGGLQANHIRDCNESLCCNPEHLYEGTQQDNIHDSIAIGHNKELNKERHSCGRVYSISPTTGHRYCQYCKNIRRMTWRAAKRRQ